MPAGVGEKMAPFASLVKGWMRNIATCLGASALSVAVPRIGLRSSKEQMVRSDARGVVAMVADVHSGRDLAEVKAP